jgi:hypothetical protein
MGRHKDRKAQTQRDILMQAVGVGNLRWKFYECRASAEIFISNIDKVLGKKS